MEPEFKKALTLAELQKAVGQLRSRSILPKVVRSGSQAKRMTARDVAGRYWTKGQKYYAYETCNIFTCCEAK